MDLDIPPAEDRTPQWLTTIEPPTLRDQFAMAALTGMATHPETFNNPGEFAQAAYNIADAMMDRRDRDRAIAELDE